MKRQSTARRHFLRGAGGFLLGLPFLESLAERTASAGDPPFSATPRFVGMMSRHGGVWNSNTYPSDAAAPIRTTLYPGHDIHHGPLTPTIQGNNAVLSRVVTAPSNKLTPALASKMNLLCGLDVPWYMSHNWGAIMGNLEAGSYPRVARPTIDQVMAYSSSFYPDASAIRLRSMQIGSEDFGGIAWGYADPANQSGPIQAVPASRSSRQLFDQIFVPDSSEPMRPLVVDRVIENYRSLSAGAFGHASRLSAADRAQLDAHMDRLRDLETRLGAVASCGDIPIPNEDATGFPPYQNLSDTRRYYELYNDVIVAAFMCGTSRIATIMPWESFSVETNIGDWHEEIAHQADQPNGIAQGILADSKRNMFEYLFLDLMQKLDVEEANGKTYLDNSLLFWTQECGDVAHSSTSYPVITAGSAAGFLKTGLYVDYRNRENLSMPNRDYLPSYGARRPGILYSQWLATILQSMGLPPSEWERPGEKGYLEPYHENEEVWPSRLLADASEVLPLLKA